MNWKNALTWKTALAAVAVLFVLIISQLLPVTYASGGSEIPTTLRPIYVLQEGSGNGVTGNVYNVDGTYVVIGYLGEVDHFCPDCLAPVCEANYVVPAQPTDAPVGPNPDPTDVPVPEPSPVPSNPTPIPPDPPEDIPTKCNNGGGNGSEGCNATDNPNSNQDEGE